MQQQNAEKKTKHTQVAQTTNKSAQFSTFKKPYSFLMLQDEVCQYERPDPMLSGPCS
jgi:hypothetical protein